MQIVIPMSGFGERFRKAGYTKPKPLIEIDGRPIIAHVIDLFPGENNFLFICNQEHLDVAEYKMAETIFQYCPTGRIVGIAPHKLGPVHAVLQAIDQIATDEPVVVNYCDFTCYWDWQNFKSFVQKTNCLGAIPAYRGFHPHSLGSTNYAYLRQTGGWVQDIREKEPFTANRMDEFTSTGTYYFATGALMKDAFTRMQKADLTVGGEFYVSLAYRILLANGASVAVYPIQHFMQWGTPEDVAEYKGWSKAFRLVLKNKPSNEQPQGALVVPMAGLGQRFVDAGYATPKPLLQVSGEAMVIQATLDLPPARYHAFVLRSDMQGYADIVAKLKATFPDTVIETRESVTEGQACTALLGLTALERVHGGSIPGPITFGACDNGAIYEHTQFKHLAEQPDIDVIVWAVRGYANAVRTPKMFGWIDADNTGRIRSISVKTPLASPQTDPVVLGTFTFRRAEDFKRAVERQIARDGRVNGEYYLDSCINDALELGLNCRLFEVESYLGWGTPNDLKTFEYWQACFHKWSGHPYRLELDHRVAEGELIALEQRYSQHLPDANDWLT